MQHKLFGVFYTLICFFGSMLLAFGAEFLVEDKYVFMGLIVLSLAFLIFGIILCAERKNLFPFYWEIIATEIIITLLILPTGLLKKFLEFRNQFDYYWEIDWFKGLQWVSYIIVPALALFLLAIVTGIMDFFRYLSEQGVFESKEEDKDKVRFL